MTTIENQNFPQERALYALSDALVKNCRFEGEADGESALKEARNIKVEGCFMDLRYPFWHVTDATISNTHFSGTCRAPLWYDKNITIEGCSLEGIKALRECECITLKNSTVNSEEFFWKSCDLAIENVIIEQSEYPFFEINRAVINGLKLKGKYSFQYCSDIKIENSQLDTKDAFWHTKNVTVRNSIISGEYLGWYSENLVLENCHISGTQPFCYCKNLVIKNCTMENCDLSFERSTVQVQVNGKIDSIKNPLSGKISASSIGEIIMEEEFVDSSKTQITLA